MELKWMGALLIIAGCGGFGFTLAANHRREERALRQLIAALDYMACELQYRLTPLPELCRQAGRESDGCTGTVLVTLAEELEDQISPDVSTCMLAALRKSKDVPSVAEGCLRSLGGSLGRFDLEGQIKGLESVRANCRRELESLSRNKEERLRSYQTLSLCAGAALAILFL